MNPSLRLARDPWRQRLARAFSLRYIAPRETHSA
jgi:hypothetical protein